MFIKWVEKQFATITYYLDKISNLLEKKCNEKACHEDFYKKQFQAIGCEVDENGEIKSSGAGYRKKWKETPPVTTCITLGNVYSIEKIYAGAGIKANVNADNDLAEVKLEIFLNASDWCKFQSQLFYLELIQYLDSLEIQKSQENPERQLNL